MPYPPPPQSCIAASKGSPAPPVTRPEFLRTAEPAIEQSKSRSDGIRTALSGVCSSGAAGAEAFTRDARNLLTALDLYADLLNGPGVLSLVHGHYGDAIRQLADRSTALLENVLASAQTAAVAMPNPNTCAEGLDTGEGSGFPYQSHEPLCDPGVVLRRYMSLLQAQTGGSAELILCLPGDLPALPVAGEVLECVTGLLICQALAALRATERNPGQTERAACDVSPRKVWISLQVREGSARLCVEGSGLGQPYRAAALQSTSWYGAGLAGALGNVGSAPGYGGVEESAPSVQSLVAATGGRLSVRSRAAGGTTATVFWPLAESSLARPMPRCESAGSRGRTAIAC